MRQIPIRDAPGEVSGTSSSAREQGRASAPMSRPGAGRPRMDGRLESTTLQHASEPERAQSAPAVDSPWLSASIITAVVLFIVREVWTVWRDIKRRRQATFALKVLLAEETERNYWAFKRTFAVLEEVSDLDHSDGRTAGSWVDRSGTMHATFTIMGEAQPHSSLALFDYTTARYERLADKVAELDQGLFRAVQAFYHDLAEWKHELAILERYLSGQIDGPFADRASTQAFLADLCTEGNQRDEVFKQFYGKLVSTELKPRVR